MSSAIELKALIPQYRICWGSYPEKEVVDGELRQIGFRVKLYGTYPSELIHASPGYVRTYEVWAALKEVAQWVVPRKSSAAAYEIEAFDNAIRYSGIRRNRSDVELHIRIIQKCGLALVDQSELDCLKQITASLSKLGVPEGY